MGTILVLGNSSGGLYDFRNELLLKLLQKHRVVVSLPDEVKTKELAEEGCEVRFTEINRRGMNPLQDIRLYRSYKKLLKEVKPDMVLLYTIKPDVYGGLACRMGKVPYMATITGLGSTFQKDNFLKKLIVHMYRTGLKRSECIFFQNEQNRRIFEECGIKGKKSLLVHGSGVNLAKHTPVPYPEQERTRFLFIGRIMREKGIEEFLEAAKALHGENVTFETLGYCDEDYGELLDTYEKQGMVTQHGFHTNVEDYLKDASAIVLPTYHEGMSNVLMEAAATARPVIATNISGCKEIVEDGVTGFLCEPKDAAGLQEALKKFLALPTEERARMGLRGREKMEREFDRNLITDVYIKEIENVVK